MWITVSLVPDLLSCNLFLGWHVFKANMTTLLGSFAWKVIVCTTKVRYETFRNGKKYEDKAWCLFSPLQSMGNLSRKKTLHGGTNVFEEIYGRGMFCMGTNDQIMKGEGELRIKRFQRLTRA